MISFIEDVKEGDVFFFADDSNPWFRIFQLTGISRRPDDSILLDVSAYRWCGGKEVVPCGLTVRRESPVIKVGTFRAEDPR